MKYQTTCSLCLFFLCGVAQLAAAQGVATYTMEFVATWSATTHPDGFPGTPHFSGLIGGVHNESAEFWTPGGLASRGIKTMAELGATEPLRNEVNAAISNGTAGQVLSGGGIGRSPGSQRLPSFDITPEYPLVTLVSMLAPSPDWFVGVGGLSLLKDGQWQQSVEITLFVYDAGTDSGMSYGSANQVTSPRERIRRIESAPFVVNGNVKPVGTFTFTLQQVEGPRSITLSAFPARVAEDVATAPEVVVTATVGGGTFARMQTVTVRVGKSGDSATEGTDYVAVNDFPIMIRAGASLATGVFTLDPEDDAIFEGDETVSVSGSLSGRTVTATSITIVEDDAESTALALMISPESVGEGEDIGVVSLEVMASLNAGATDEDITVTINVSDGTADSDDYRVVGELPSLMISAGETSITGMVEIEITDDDLVEEDETVVIEAFARGLDIAREELTITDNDASLSVTVSLSEVVEDVETAPEVTVTVTVDNDGMFVDGQTVMVSVGASEDSATEGTDYAVVDDFEIMIPAGAPSATGTFTLDPEDDNIAEGSETVSVVGSLIGKMVTPAMITITDDDAPSTALTLTIAAPARLHEGSGTSWVRFSAGLGGAAHVTDTPVEISVTTEGTAVEDTDYSIPMELPSLIIPGGQMSIRDSLQIAVINDDIMEGDETIAIEVSSMGLTSSMQNLVIIDDESAVRVDTLMVDANDNGYTITAPVRQNMGAPVTGVELYYGDAITFEMAPMEMSSEGLYTADLMAPAEGGILYYYVEATNGDGLTATYPSEGRYWDVSDYTEGSRLVFLDFENDDASDQSAARHHVSYKGGEPTFAEGALVLDGVDDHVEILGSSLGVSEEFALEIMFNADDVDAQALDGNEEYLVAKPVECDTCWEGSTFSLLWGRGSDDTYVSARFGNSEYEGGQVELEIPLALAKGQWYHAMLEVQRKDAGQRAVLQLRDGSGMLYGEDAAVLPAPPAISTYPIFVGHIGNLGFFDGRIDDVAFYNYAHFGLSLTNVEDAEEVPEGYVLEQNYPNPFNPVTAIRYDLARGGHVRLEVSDLLGRRVALLVDEVQQAGVQEVRFDAGDLPSGMYLYRLRVEDFVSVKKMVLLK